MDEKLKELNEKFEQFAQEFTSFLQRLDAKIAAGDLTSEKQEQIAKGLSAIRHVLDGMFRVPDGRSVNPPGPNSDAPSESH
jgi:hypothetical protein